MSRAFGLAAIILGASLSVASCQKKGVADTEAYFSSLVSSVGGTTSTSTASATGTIVAPIPLPPSVPPLPPVPSLPPSEDDDEDDEKPLTEQGFDLRLQKVEGAKVERVEIEPQNKDFAVVSVAPGSYEVFAKSPIDKYVVVTPRANEGVPKEIASGELHGGKKIPERLPLNEYGDFTVSVRYTNHSIDVLQIKVRPKESWVLGLVKDALEKTGGSLGRPAGGDEVQVRPPFSAESFNLLVNGSHPPLKSAREGYVVVKPNEMIEIKTDGGEKVVQVSIDYIAGKGVKHQFSKVYNENVALQRRFELPQGEKVALYRVSAILEKDGQVVKEFLYVSVTDDETLETKLKDGFSGAKLSSDNFAKSL